MEFVGTIAQTMGLGVASLINPEEFLKRLAAASGIETLGLIKLRNNSPRRRNKHRASNADPGHGSARPVG